MSWERKEYQSVFFEVLETFDDELGVVGGNFVSGGHVSERAGFRV